MSELPDSWLIGAIADLVDVGPKNQCDDCTVVGFVPMNRMGKSFRDTPTFEARKWSEVKKGYTHFADGDVLVARITPCFENGKAGIARGLPNGMGAGSTEYVVLRPKAGVATAEYVLARLKTDEFLSKGAHAMTGAVGQQRVPKAVIESYPVPIAPFPEQQRISLKLTALLADVDACRERLDRVPQILKKFREAVLEAAVSGRLTHKNTDSNGGSSELPSGWTSSAFSELISNIRTGTTAVPQDSPTKYPVLRSSSVRPLSVDLSDFRFLAKDQSANEDNFLAPGDLLFTRLSGSKEFVGNCAMVREVSAQRVQYPDRLFRARLKTPEAGRYIEIAFASATVRKQVEAKVKSSAGHQRVSTDAITGALIPIPPKPIQESIVRIVDQLFAVADDLERRYKDSVLRVAKLTPSVLAKAFRGELVPQDPNDEPAGEMLERMLAQRTSLPK